MCLIKIVIALIHLMEMGAHSFPMNANPIPMVSKPGESRSAEGWEYTSFRAEGLDPSRYDILKKKVLEGTFKDINSIIVVRKGKILVEDYFNGEDRDTLHDIRSATKSIGSALLGIAIDRGYIEGVNEKLYDFFPEYRKGKHWDDRKNRITLEHVLNMTTGLDTDDWSDPSGSQGSETLLIESSDFVDFMLSLPLVHEPGERWAYSTGTSHMMGAVIEKATGMSVVEFADQYLFQPLGINAYQWKIAQGGAHTGGGFRMRAMDMARFGQLFLLKGSWQGKRILSEEWILQSAQSFHSPTRDLHYGYQWWKTGFRVNGRRHDAVFAVGNGENFIFLFPEIETVVALTGSVYDRMDGPAQSRLVMNKYILPTVVPQGISLVPFKNEESGLRGVAPAGWLEMKPGMFMKPGVFMEGIPHDESGALLLLKKIPPIPIEQGLGFMAAGLGLETVPKPPKAVPFETEPFTWDLYTVEVEHPSGRIMWDIGLTKTLKECCLVFMQTMADEQDTLHDTVFLPVVNSLKLKD